MSYDINEIVNPKAIEGLSKIEQETAKVVANILKIHDASAKLDSTLAKIDGSKIKKLETATKEATKNNEGLSKSTVKLKNLQTDYMKTLTGLAKQKERATKKTTEQIKAEKDLAIVNSKTAGTLEKLTAKNRILHREINKLDLDTEKGRKLLQKKNAELDKNNKRIKDNADALKKQKIGIGGYQEAIEGSIPALRGASQATRGFGATMKALLANPVILFLAAIVGAFMALRKALTRSEKGQDALNKITQVFSAVLNRLADIVTFVAEKLIYAFTEPKKAIAGLWDFLKSQFINRIHAFEKMMGSLGKLMNSVFHLDVAGIKKNAAAAGSAFIDLETGVTNTLGKIKEAVKKESKSLSDAAELGKKFAIMQNQFKRDERADLVKNAALQIRAAQIFAHAERIKRENGEKTIKLYNKGYAIQKKIASNELELAKKKEAMLITQSKIAKNDAEMNMKLAQAKADVLNKTAAIEQIEIQKQRRLAMVRMQAFTQENLNLKAKLALEKTVFDKEVLINKQLLDDTRISLQEKIQILAKDIQAQEDFAKRSAELALAALKKKHELHLLSESDFKTQSAAIYAKLELQKEQITTAGEQKITQITLKDLNFRLHQSEAKITENQKRQVTTLKKMYASGLISQQEYENQKNDIIYQSGQKAIEIHMASLKKQIDSIKTNTEQKAALEQQYTDLSIQMDNMRTDNAIQNEQKRRQAVTDTLRTIQGIENGLFNFATALNQRKITKLQEAEKQELAAAGNNAEKKKQIQEHYHKEIAKLKRKQAIADKAEALFNVAINTAVAVTKVWGQTGIFGVAAQIPILIMGALEAAAIMAKPIPKYAAGTKNAPGGLAITGEAGTEIIEQDGQIGIVDKPTLSYLKPGAKVYNSFETQQIFAQAGKDDFIVKDAIDRQTQSIVETIRNKKEIHFTTRGLMVNERDGQYFKEYLNRKIEF